MLTKNGRNCLLTGVGAYSLDYKDINGTLGSVGPSYMVYPFKSGYQAVYKGSFTDKKAYCVVGNGTTKETEDDYCMETQDTKLTNVSFALNQTLDSDGVFGNEKISLVATYSNDTTSDVTVSEIGIIFAYSGQRYLLYRKTFEPITLAPNETYMFTIDFM